MASAKVVTTSELNELKYNIQDIRGARFKFPVSLETFKRHINYDELIRPILMKAAQDESKAAAMMNCPKQCDWQFLRFYRSFYVYPDRRQQYNYHFKTDNAVLKQRLLSLAEPLNEKALKIFSSNQTFERPKPSTETDLNGYSIQESLLPVNFKNFSRHILNLPDIVDNMLCSKEYSCMSKEECAKKYYKAFYTDSKIRKRYKVKLKPCPSKIRRNLLAMASKVAKLNALDDPVDLPQEDTDVASRIQSEQIVVPKKKIRKNQDVEKALNLLSPNQIVEPQKTTTETYPNAYSIQELPLPVSYRAFSRHILNLPDIVDKMLCSKEYSGMSRKECSQKYYKAFYTDPKMRQKYKYKLKPCPSKIRRNLLAIASSIKQTKPLGDSIGSPQKNKDNASRIQREQIVISKKNIRETNQNLGKTLDLLSPNQIVEPHQTSTETDLNAYSIQKSPLPVNFKDFSRYILNLPDIVDKMLCSKECSGMSREECAKKYYRAFYTDSNIRKKYKYKLKPCPSKIRETLLAIASNVEDLKPLDDAPDSPKKDTDIASLIQSEQIVIANTVLPVNFTDFSRHILNLPDIVDNMLCSEEYSGMSKEECAKKYYRAFYTDSKMRKKYKYKLKPCPSKIRNNFLAMASNVKQLKPLNDTPESPQNNADIASLIQRIQIVIPIGNILYEFPVSFQTFQKYINYDELIVELALCSSNSTATLADKEMCLNLLKDFYYSFYINGEIRSQFKYNFKKAPKYLQINLNAMAVQLNKVDEIEGLTMVDPKPNTGIMPRSIPAVFTKTFPRRTIGSSFDEGTMLSTEGIATNLLNTEKHALKSNTKLTAVKALNLLSPNQIVEPQKTSTQTDLNAYSIQKSLLPVNYKVFSRHILNLPEIVNSMLCSNEYSGMSKEECAKKYYRAFYTDSKIRKKYKYKLKPCPSKIRNNLLAVASNVEQLKPLDDPPKSPQNNADIASLIQREEIVIPKEHIRKTQEDIEKALNLLSPNQIVEPQQTSTETDLNSYSIQEAPLPVNYRAFSRHILNLPDIVDKMLCSKEYSGMTSEECAQKYYRAFYTDSKIRNKYNIKLKPCPSKIRKNLLTMASNVEQFKSLDDTPDSPQNNTDLAPLIQNEPIVISIENIHYEFPVPFQTFQKYINYDELIVELSLCSSNSTATLADKEMCLNLLKDFYYSFYINVEIRCQFKYNFNRAPKTLQTSLNAMAIRLENVVEIEGLTMVDPKPNTGNMSLPIPVVVTNTFPTQTTDNCVDEGPMTTPERTALKSKTKQNVMNFVPTNLREYITCKLKCPQKSLEVEKYFLSTFDKREELKNAEDQFFADNSVEHTIQYLLHNTHGRAMHIWHILSKLSLEEFRAHTGIYNAQEFYENNNILTLCYKHVIENGCWPLNLYVKMETFRQLLQAKGIEMPLYEFEHISPKILHWSELQLYTNFEEIVESHYSYQTSKKIEDYVSLLKEMEKLYTQCWLHNQWIHQVPKITESPLMAVKSPAAVSDLPTSAEEPSHVPASAHLHSHTLIESEPSLHVVDSAPTVNKAVATVACSPDLFPVDSSGETVVRETSNAALLTSTDPQMGISICPPTQLDSSHIENTTGAEAPTAVHNISNESPMPAAKLTAQCGQQIKQEPIKCLDKLRFDLNNSESDDYDCERINSEENIIIIDGESDNSGGELQCFEIPKGRDCTLPNACVDIPDHTSMLVDDNESTAGEVQQNSANIVRQATTDILKTGEVEAFNASAAEHCVASANQLPNGPIFTRPALAQTSAKRSIPAAPLPNDQPQQPPLQPTITVSQVLATDNSIFDSTQIRVALGEQMDPSRKRNT
ncbi:protein telomere ends associated-like [Scaptodrosophila lebanonensis]|uniref:Protein telomere ends associated-like n=1 Tax=Drosophila lebanonensis TaxID=7225 RepID=A0A6J2U3N0_DROLE|nr:protein telomere ends associated-like [Scaptodrosophila lebanonensis]